ncbi:MULTISPECIES: EndoU domain-containing protein [Streptomyces]|uniref:EndoU domain-containing protein n=1 Tax=Streptomyces ramulosus TaxID=47762 RepID=A0ABW1FV29_9ACTN
MKHRWKTRAAVPLLSLSLLLTGYLPSASAAPTESSAFDLGISKVLAQCHDLLPSKKVACIKSKAKELAGDSIEECAKEPLAGRVPCITDRIREETAKVKSLITGAHVIYQGMHGRNSENSVLGNLYQVERIRANPLVLLEDKELLAGLKRDLQAEISEMKGVDGNGNCRPDASLLGNLNCLTAEYFPQVTTEKIVTWVAYANILGLYAADRHEVRKEIATLQADLAKAIDDPEQIKDAAYRKQLIEEIEEVRERAAANTEFWKSFGSEMLARLDEAAKDIQEIKKGTGKTVDNEGKEITWGGVGGPEWDKTFKDLEEGFAPGSDWDKTFGPNGSMQQTLKNLDRTNKELAKANQDLKQTNRELAQMNRDLDQMNKSIGAGMKSIDAGMKSLDASMKSLDRHVAGVGEDVAAMRKIQNRKHPEVWENLYKDLDLSGIPEYVHGGPLPQDNKVKNLITSAIMDVVPVVGDAKGIAELLSGRDAVTEEKLSVPERLIGAVIVSRWAKAGKDAIKANDLAKAIKATEKISRKFPDAARQHVLKGEIKYGSNGQARVTGYHARPGGKDRPGVKVPKISKRDPKTGLSQGEVWMKNPRDGQWVKKRARSTFFPDTWTLEESDRAIRKAFERATVTDAENHIWVGTYKGIKVEGYYDPATGHALTAYPVIP